MTAAEQIRALIRDRDTRSSLSYQNGYIDGLKSAIAIIEAEDAKRTEAIKAMVEALKPFNNVAEHDIGTDETDYDLFKPISYDHLALAPRLTVGDLRRASIALNLARAAGLIEERHS